MYPTPYPTPWPDVHFSDRDRSARQHGISSYTYPAASTPRKSEIHYHDIVLIYIYIKCYSNQVNPVSNPVDLISTSTEVFQSARTAEHRRINARQKSFQ